MVVVYLQLLNSMLKLLPQNKCLLVDVHMLPRYWPCVWSIYHEGGLAESTHRQKLRDIEALYVHAEGMGCNLDDALYKLDLAALGSALEAFFVTLRNTSGSSFSAVRRWNTTFHFVHDTCERLERDPHVGNKMADIRARMSRLDNLYMGLRPFKRRMGNKVRAIPRSVLIELMETVTPGSTTNPFEYDKTQWRVFALVTLLLFEGLRQGEALTLTADFLKSERDPVSGQPKYYLSVLTDESLDDPRNSKPSIKTVDSIRTLPITEQTATGLQVYLDNYRGKPNHAFFLSSIQNKPLSAEGVRLVMKRISNALSSQSRVKLKNLTGNDCVTAHSFRHTCAVVRLKQWLANGLSPEQAMANMRSFFGWSKESTMPLLYGKAALDERLNESWNEALDDRLNMLRNLPE